MTKSSETSGVTDKYLSELVNTIFTNQEVLDIMKIINEEDNESWNGLSDNAKVSYAATHQNIHYLDPDDKIFLEKIGIKLNIDECWSRDKCYGNQNDENENPETKFLSSIGEPRRTYLLSLIGMYVAISEKDLLRERKNPDEEDCVEKLSDKPKDTTEKKQWEAFVRYLSLEKFFDEHEELIMAYQNWHTMSDTTIEKDWEKKYPSFEEYLEKHRID